MPTSDQNKPQRPSFAERLRATRKSRGFRTARSFAERIGVDQNTYTRYERGEVEPNIGLIERMWEALALPSTELFGADPLRPPGLSESGPRPSAEPAASRAAMAWQLADAYVRCRAADGHDRLAAVRSTARVYADLAADPFGTVARLVADPAIERADEGLRSEFLRLVCGFTVLRAGDHRDSSDGDRGA